MLPSSSPPKPYNVFSSSERAKPIICFVKPLPSGRYEDLFSQITIKLINKIYIFFHYNLQ